MNKSFDTSMQNNYSTKNIEKIITLKNKSELYQYIGDVDLWSAFSLYKENYSFEKIVEKGIELKRDFYKEIKKIIDFDSELKITKELFPLLDHYVEYLINNEPLSEQEKNNILRAKEFLPRLKDANVPIYFQKVAQKVTSFEKFLSITNLIKKKKIIPKKLKPFFEEKDLLINVSNFEALPEFAFHYKKENLVIYPSLEYDLKHKIFDLVRKKGNLNLAISLGRCNHISEHSKTIYCQEEKLFGIPFKKENIKNIFNKQYGTYEYIFEDDAEEMRSRVFHVPLLQLQYVIKPYDGSSEKLSLSLEEVVDIQKEEYSQYNYSVFADKRFILNRYIHMIFNTRTFLVEHLDLSYLYYDNKSYKKRINFHIKDKVISATIKDKIFAIKDDTIDWEDALLIIGASLNHNPEVERFLKGE